MEIKKSKKADLEKYIGLFFEIGLILGLVIILFAFEWTTAPKTDGNTWLIAGTTYEPDIIQSIPREDQKPEPFVQRKLVEMFILVDNDVNLEGEFDFDASADQNTSFIYPGITDGKEKFTDDTIYYIVKDMPMFNGGDPNVEFWKYIKDNLEYPSIASENGISGKVIIQFVVNEHGQVTDAVVALSADPALDKEALRVILSSPAWTPGKKWGRPVKVFYTFPINFMLQN